jgi:mono/diheme cytochrome c family protein
MRRSRSSAAILLLSIAFVACGSGDDGASGDSDLIARGREAYEQTCAACHGADLKGTSTGPPFLDPIYAPNHHPDQSFYSAVANGVAPHHWDFGPMPPQTAVATAEVEAIIAYVRAEQEAAGITEDPSH